MTARSASATSGGAFALASLLLVSSFSLFLGALPTAAAQVPPLPELPGAGNFTAPSGNAVKQIALGLNVTYAEIVYPGQVYVTVTLEDLSRDSFSQPGASTQPNWIQQDEIKIALTWLTNDSRAPRGFSAAMDFSTEYLYGGQTKVGSLVVSNGGAIEDPLVRILVNATYTNPYDGSQLTDDETLTVRVRPFYQGLVAIAEYPTDSELGQLETLEVPVEVHNLGVYPDTFALEVVAPEGFQTHVAPRVYLEPLSTRVVNVTIVTPYGKIYELGRPATIFIQGRSVNDPAITYTAVVPLQLRGAYIPAYWIPLFLLAVVSTASLVSRRLERSELARLEKGRPRYPEPSPKQAVLLAELKRRDKAAAREREAQLDAIYKARLKEYRERRRDEAAAEKLEVRAARAELKRDRRVRKERRTRERLEAKIRAKAERAERKEQRKRANALGKQRKKLEKRRAKALKKQAKVDARNAKKAAKAAARQAKIDAKDAKRAAKEAKKAAKAAKKKSP